LRATLSAGDRDAKLGSLSRAVRQGIQVAMLGTGALLVMDFQASGGVMIAASILGSRALAPIESMMGLWKTIVATSLARERLNKLLQRTRPRDEGMALPAPEGRVVGEQMSFALPGMPKPIISRVSFDLQPGEALGIIGPSGSGKSSLARLLVGAWPCTAGNMRLDGADIYTWPRTELGRYIGYLPQDVELFAGTVRENIARMSDAKPDDIVAAAQLAHAHEMILSLPKGYDTDIGDGGHKLSGGQRQRVGLARALFGQPRFIVLDEPNANLDGPGEMALLRTLTELKRRKVSVILIAHRPSILNGCDKMLMLRDGVVEAYGPRAQVMQRFSSAPAQPGQAQTNVIPLSSVGGTDGDGA
jgi:ATP-binding cassette subfamily C protein/ATP-binding cassette subfamily C protein EexD